MVLNYYGFATSTIKASSIVPIQMPALESQTQNQTLLEEIRELLRGIQRERLAWETLGNAASGHSSRPGYAEFPADHDGSNMHIVFSMSCDQRNRLLQQTVVQLTASWVGQKGPITQILSGCSEATLYYDFRRHFTPSFAVNPGRGLRTNTRRTTSRSVSPLSPNASDVKHDIIALVDGDFFFFRPLEANMGRNMSKYYHGRRDPLTVDDTRRMERTPRRILREDKADVLNKVCGGLPCGNVSREDGAEYYGSIGPPYIMTRRDALRMVDDYCHLCVTTRQVSNEWIAEMFAYSVAAANNGIKHTALSHLGISSPNFKVADTRSTCHGPACQWIGNFYKGVWPNTLANCDSPMLKVPPSTDCRAKSQRIRREEVWAKCTLTKIMNRALVELKQRTCHSGFNTFRGIDAVRMD
ncbi:hypothetical protein GQ600_975 [Phytophthora cactorum]|nr:hypothetical protein GQ600_975 [Phytophthora cactorum]